MTFIKWRLLSCQPPSWVFYLWKSLFSGYTSELSYFLAQWTPPQPSKAILCPSSGMLEAVESSVLCCASSFQLCRTLWISASSILCLWNSPGKNTGEGFHALIPGTFQTQGLNPSLLRLLHCRWILYHWATEEAHSTLGSRRPKIVSCPQRMPCLLFIISTPDTQ